MEWLFILGLLGWALMLTIRVGDLKGELRDVQRRLVDLKAEQDVFRAGSPSAPTSGPEKTVKPMTAAAAPSPVAAPPSAQPVPLAAQTTIVPRVVAPAKPAGPPVREQAAAWLAENGLAWIGGAVLALGGIFLVAYAAERGFFTPPMRIASAVVLGAGLVAGSEWLKRRFGNLLAAALAAGAGAATLYAAAWASYWLYSFIGLGAAGALMGLISLGLLGLALRHGEPLGLLAVGGALIAPAITGPHHWDAPALTAYLGLAVFTGYAAAGWRRWGQLGQLTLAGAALWAAAGFAAEGYARVAALAVGPIALALAAVEWRRRHAPDEPAGLSSFALLPAAALAVGAVLIAPLGFVGAGKSFVAAATAAILILTLGAYAARRALIPPPLQLAAHAAALLATLATVHSSGVAMEVWSGAVALAAAVSGLWAARGASDDDTRLFPAGGALVALIIAVAVQGPLSAHAPWAPPLAGAAVLGVCAVLLVRRTVAPEGSVALALWLWAATAALLEALRVASPPTFLPVVLAVPAAGFAVAHARIGWRGFAGAAIASALASFAALLNPALLRPVFASHATPWALAAAAFVAAGVVAGAARLSRERPGSEAPAKSLTSAAMLIALAGAGLMLRYWGAVGGRDWRLDPFAEASLRTLTLLAAGLLSTMAVREDSHPIGRWRGHALLILGLAHGAAMQLIGFNPLWAGWTPAVSGPPLVDSLALGFLAPAVIFVVAATRRMTPVRGLAAAYAAAGFAFGLAWAALEIRRLFQSASLHLGVDPVGRAEMAAYALLALAVAAGLLELARQAARRGWGVDGLALRIRNVGIAASWIALAIAVLTFGYLASPWWGPIGKPIASQAAAGLLAAFYAAGGAVTVWLARDGERQTQTTLARAARISVVITAFALMNLLVRYGFRGLDMRPRLTEASLETWAFSAAWGAFGFGLVVAGAARRSSDLRWAGLAVLLATLGKIFLFDMAHLAGVVRAASFLAVGGLLLTAAVLARRLSDRDRTPAG